MKKVAIVDPYSSGQYLADEFYVRGYLCVCIHSSVTIPGIYAESYFADNFVAEIFSTGDNFDEILAFLGNHCCEAIVVGTESGVLLANQLAARLHFPCCAPETLPCLRDKYLMQERIAQAGLRAIPHKKVTHFTELFPWLNQQDISTVVVKPLCSAGTDNVKICHSHQQIQQAISGIIGTDDLLGNKNEAVVVQQYIAGQEYVVDSVSLNGAHYITNVSLYHKQILDNGSVVYAEERFIHPDTTDIAPVIDYAKKVMDALGIHFGAAHAEIMVDQYGPVLIEVAARLHGAKAPRNVQFFSDISQLDLLVDAAIDPPRFQQRTSKSPVWHKHSKAVSMINYDSGKIVAIPGKKWAETLSSYTVAFWNIDIGQMLLPTSNLVDSPGGIFLASHDPAVLEADTKRIRAMEKAGRLWRLE